MSIDHRPEAAFDAALRRAARSIVQEPLPAGIFGVPDAPARPAWSAVAGPLGGLAGLAVVVVVVVIAIAVRGPGPAPGGSGLGPNLKTPGEIELELRGAGFSCSAGPAASPSVAQSEAVVCAAPATLRPAVGAVSVFVDGAGGTSAVSIKADIAGAATSTGEANRQLLLSRVLIAAFVDPRDGAAAGRWLVATVPFSIGDRAETTIGGLRLVLERNPGGGYRMEIEAPPGSD